MNIRLLASAQAIIVFGSLAAVPTSLMARTSTVAGLKTAGACNDEYKANKGALKDAKERKKNFIAACRALAPGTPTPIGATAAAPATPTTAPTPVPAPQTTQPTRAPSPAPTRSVPSSAASGDGSGYSHPPSSPTAVQFASEAGAKSHCPGATVVWVNTNSGVYHFAGQRNYGHTKNGAFECETDAKAEGDRATKNGQ